MGRFEQGELHLDGEQALAYSRARYTSVVSESTDFARSVRQARILAALRAKLGDGGVGSIGPGPGAHGRDGGPGPHRPVRDRPVPPLVAPVERPPRRAHRGPGPDGDDEHRSASTSSSRPAGPGRATTAASSSTSPTSWRSRPNRPRPRPMRRRRRLRPPISRGSSSAASSSSPGCSAADTAASRAPTCWPPMTRAGSSSCAPRTSAGLDAPRRPRRARRDAARGRGPRDAGGDRARGRRRAAALVDARRARDT